ncbi:MAG TPA: DUF2141 domain-containing protein [Puia sp.]|nr:DUF2141 domain-containing protein [Puia sp.]
MRTLFLLMTALFFRTIASNGTLTVTILDLKNNQGRVSVALYNKEAAFPKSPDKAVKILFAPIRDKKSIVVFDSLPPGEYAISVYHDENNNGKMDTNFFGIPKEGVGASNDARGHLGPPHYKDAKFNFSGGIQSISIHIIYL